MSYAFHVFESPKVSDPDDAVAALDRGRATASRARIAAFTKALRVTYPDRAMLEALGRDPGESAWTQSPLEPTSDGVYVLEISPGRISGNLLNTMGYVAADQGLLVIDRNHDPGILYRDRQVVFRGGSTKPLPAPVAPEDAPPFKAPFSPGEVIRRLATLTAARQASRGFAAYLDGEHDYQWCAWRDHGEVRQAIQFTASWVEDPGVYMVGAVFHFGAASLWAALERNAPRWAADVEHNRRHLGPSFGNVYSHPIDLFEETRQGVWRDMFPRVRPRDLESWGAQFNDWLERSALPQLDAARDLAGLRHLLFTAHRRGRLEHAEWSFSDIATTLFLLRLPGASADDEAVWWPLLEAHARKAFHYPLQRPPQDPARIHAEELMAAIARLRDRLEDA